MELPTAERAKTRLKKASIHFKNRGCKYTSGAHCPTPLGMGVSGKFASVHRVRRSAFQWASFPTFRRILRPLSSRRSRRRLITNGIHLSPSTLVFPHVWSLTYKRKGTIATLTSATMARAMLSDTSRFLSADVDTSRIPSRRQGMHVICRYFMSFVQNATIS